MLLIERSNRSSQFERPIVHRERRVAVQLRQEVTSAVALLGKSRTLEKRWKRLAGRASHKPLSRMRHMS